MQIALFSMSLLWHTSGSLTSVSLWRYLQISVCCLKLGELFGICSLRRAHPRAGGLGTFAKICHICVNLQEALEIENQVVRSHVSGCPELGPWPESEEEAGARIAHERAKMVLQRIQALRASDPE